MARNNGLRTARVLLGLPQLAQEIGKKEIEVSRLEKGRAVPDEAVMRRIAEIFD
jgi:ribosome-binding protein aMBF1 (putative translation factor)